MFVYVPESFLEDMNDGLKQGLKLLREIEKKTGKEFTLIFKFNKDQQIQMHVEPVDTKME